MTGDDPIEAYLDDLFVHLRGSPRAIRRVLTEAEGHLRDAVEAGATPDEAVVRFGEARQVAARCSEQAAVPLPAILRELALLVGLLVAVGAVAVGVSGALSVGMDAAFGATFVAGDQPTVTYTADRCAEYHDLAPGQATCARAAARHHTDEIEVTRVATGVLGIALLGALFWVRRRSTAKRVRSALPPAMRSTVGVTVFGVAALALAAQSLQDFGWGTTNGLGQWLSAAIVSVIVAGGFAFVLLRDLRRPPSATS
ncbi:MAG: hypothetical protein JO291_06540 [Acidimicrobiia bacterium]|nr:hypothetical protein [Acidimicrobiia bacterium]